MATSSDRRAQGASRIPFDAMVEVGGALGPSFEARALNLSEEGMSLRTMYLPEVGQPITCRFEAGGDAEVVAAGEVLWREDAGDGGEFGIRFTNLDVPSTIALQKILQMGEDGTLRGPNGRKIRLHIEGLASPMRARVKSEGGANVTAFSELGFLQLGKPLQLEDAMSQERRPALIDRVEVEVERESRVPQLIVTLRYDDEEGRVMEAGSLDPIVVEQTGRDAAPMHDEEDVPVDAGEPAHAREHDHAPAQAQPAPHDEEDDVGPMKSKLARGAEKARADATKAFEKISSRAKVTFAMLAAKMKKGEEPPEAPVRRMTAPPPGGALHASGRKVVRTSVPAEEEIKEAAPKVPFKITKKKAAVAGAVGVATLLMILAMRKPTPDKTAAASQATDSASIAASKLPNATPSATASNGPGFPTDTISASGDVGDPSAKGKPGKAVPFTNGPVGHGNVLKLKMDGPIGAIQGAASPTGFTVTLPGRKSLDSASPLASKDGRIAAIKVANESGGAELTVTFKDGVPNYLVKAKGDVLEMHLAKGGASGEAHHGKKKKKHH